MKLMYLNIVIITIFLTIMGNKVYSKYEPKEQVQYQKEYKYQWDYELTEADSLFLKSVVNNYKTLNLLRKNNIEKRLSLKERKTLNNLIGALDKSIQKKDKIINLSLEQRRDLMFFEKNSIIAYLHKLQINELK